MPHPKNRLKLTGDTHLPDAGIDWTLDDDEPIETVVVEEIRVFADGYVPGASEEMAMPEEMTHPEPPTTLQKVEQKIERQAASKPWMAIGAGLFFGWMVARILRS